MSNSHRMTSTVPRYCYVCSELIPGNTYFWFDGAAGDRHIGCFRPQDPCHAIRAMIDGAKAMTIRFIEELEASAPTEEERAVLRRSRQRVADMSRSEFAAYKGIV